MSNCFDVDPSDIENYPCPNCEHGVVKVTIKNKQYDCDTCDFSFNKDDRPEYYESQESMNGVSVP